MLLEKKVSELIEEISSSSPTPGGGSVSALVGALGTSLSIMVSNLTIGKKKYENVQEEIQVLKNKLEQDIKFYYDLYERDSHAFDEVMTAFRLPKSNEEEIAKRNSTIEESTVKATEVPIQVIIHSLEVARKIVRISQIGNQNSLSDAGVALILIKASADGAFINVLINTKSLNNKELARGLILKSADSLTKLDSLVSEALSTIKRSLEI